MLFILCVYLAALLTGPDHRTGILLWNLMKLHWERTFTWKSGKQISNSFEVCNPDRNRKKKKSPWPFHFLYTDLSPKHKWEGTTLGTALPTDKAELGTGRTQHTETETGLGKECQGTGTWAMGSSALHPAALQSCIPVHSRGCKLKAAPFRPAASQSHCIFPPSFHHLLIPCRPAASQFHCTFPPHFTIYLLTPWVLTVRVSQIQVSRTPTHLCLTWQRSFAELFTKAKLPSWTETCCCFPMKGLQSTGDQILPLLNGLQEKFRHLCYIPFIHNKQRMCKAALSSKTLWSSGTENSNCLFLLSTK